MKDFNYHSAKDSKEASKLASSSSAFLAGGMTTIPSMKLGLATYKDLIDIKKASASGEKSQLDAVFELKITDEEKILDLLVKEQS